MNLEDYKTGFTNVNLLMKSSLQIVMVTKVEKKWSIVPIADMMP